MQLFAKEKNKTIFVEDAIKHKDYQCLECLHPLRVRSGYFRQPHFYHVKKNSHCHQCSKSEVHLRIQLHLISRLPKNEAQMEMPFPSILRIADVAWTTQKIAFEIQCSPISQQEPERRTLDYLSIGYKPVWVLHDRLFNKSVLTQQEIFLQNHPHYFTNTERLSPVSIYDQFQIIHHNVRVHKGPKIPVHLHLAKTPSELSSFPLHLQKRNKNLFFKNDLIDQGLANPSLLDHWKEVELKCRMLSRKIPRRSVKRVYIYFMEKLCGKQS